MVVRERPVGLAVLDVSYDENSLHSVSPTKHRKALWLRVREKDLVVFRVAITNSGIDCEEHVI